MVNVIRGGSYRLVETQDKKRVLFLDEDIYFWTSSNGIGELCVGEYQKSDSDRQLCFGKYMVVDVREEASLTDVTHLELISSDGRSQGYLLLTGLPDTKSNRKRIVPTIEKVPQAYAV